MQAETKPQWLTVLPPGGERHRELKELFHGLNLHTVCEEARCPNVQECWGGGTATLMLMGDVCSRACRFCMVTPGRPSAPPDPLEPENVAFALSQMGLTYVVLTSVDRDDLPDGGAGHLAKTIRLVKERAPGMMVEVLIPDFRDDPAALRTVIAAQPNVVAHNVETTEALTRRVRDPRAGYRQSLSVLKHLKEIDPAMYTKSSIMVGLGETEPDMAQTMADLRAAGVDFLTVGQYLRPSHRHLAVEEFVPPERFEAYRKMGEDLGFKYVASGPLVRSSYRAGEFFIRSVVEKGRA